MMVVETTVEWRISGLSCRKRRSCRAEILKVVRLAVGKITWTHLKFHRVHHIGTHRLILFTQHALRPVFQGCLPQRLQLALKVLPTHLSQKWIAALDLQLKLVVMTLFTLLLVLLSKRAYWKLLDSRKLWLGSRIYYRRFCVNLILHLIDDGYLTEAEIFLARGLHCAHHHSLYITRMWRAERGRRLLELLCRLGQVR